jgi:hypothetical protein
MTTTIHERSHTHEHDAHTHDGHSHPHPVEDHSHVGTGFVVLDIGGDVGALIVTCPESLLGDEVEIGPSPVDRDRPAPHVMVLHRPQGDVKVPTLVYPELTEGTYDLWLKGNHPVQLTVEIHGGAVTQADWPTA